LKYTVGAYEFDITGHERIVTNGVVRERFTVALFLNGQPQPWHPGDSTSNVEVHEWVGREVVDVYEDRGAQTSPRYVKVGTKRGADFRTRFWPSLLYWADKARAAQTSGKRIGQVADAEITRTRISREPVDLNARTLDEAATELSRGN
jgi:hypothetical protein